MKKCLIIGYGNTLRGDDGLGPYIVESLRDTINNMGENIKLMSLPQLDVVLSSIISREDIVIFVDARTDNTDELVSINKVRPALNLSILNYTSHAISLPVLLRIAHDWYGTEPLSYLVMPKGFDFSFSSTISEKALKSADLAKNKIIEILQSFS
ncbi:hydrogenase maturation protease [candidate division KSB1 bacterium]